MDLQTLNVTIKNRDGVLFSGECRSISSYNTIGKFDILGMHANFITLLEKQIDLVTTSGQVQSIVVDNGVCKVKENNVIIFLGVKQDYENIPASPK